MFPATSRALRLAPLIPAARWVEAAGPVRTAGHPSSIRVRRASVAGVTLEDRTAGLDTGLATEVAALKGRVRRLEARRFDPPE